jgi:hypothetical protein
MIRISKYTGCQPHVWFNKNLDKSNQYCFYCGIYVGPGSEIPSNKEHLIGRKFPPKGSFARDGFNFIFRACAKCNGRKSAAERHVSTATLFMSPARSLDGSVDEVAMHKASCDYHPDKKGILMKDAGDEHVFDFWQFGILGQFTVMNPPQLNPEAVRLLACNHVQGLYTLLSSGVPSTGWEAKILPSDCVLCFYYFGYRDWGNPHLREIGRRVARWSCLGAVDAADGYFRLIFRAHEDAESLFWALEWNKSLRIIGAICSPSAEPGLFRDLPDLGWKSLPGRQGSFRWEVPLAAEDDDLFSHSLAPAL